MLLNLNHEMLICIYGGIVVYSLLIMIQVLVFTVSSVRAISSIYIYIEVEINKILHNYSNVNIYMILRNCSVILILTTIAHIISKIGIYNSISYNINFWLIGTGLGLYLCPFVVYFYRLFIYLVHYSVYQLSISNHYRHNNMFSNSVFYVQTLFSGSNYNTSYLFGIMDISIVMNIYRGINNVMNWLYQMIYYGVRLWLVFVLHSFSLGCFGELLTVITDNNMILNVFFFGLLGLGIMLFLLVFFYLGIQIYVYISFSLSFLHSTMLLLFVHPLYPNSLHNLSNNHLYNSNSSIVVSNTYLLIPVSLVDVLSLNMILYVVICYVVLLISVPMLLSSCTHLNTYSFVYKYFGSN